jgi:Xaa-Pro aminopeptidase
LKTAKQKSKNELVLMDLGAEYHGYIVDDTHHSQTVNFPQSKKLIYDLVYDAQEAGIAAATIVFFKSTDVIARKVIYEGLQKLNS